MNDQPATPTNATDARAALDAKMANSEWTARFNGGGLVEKKELHELSELIARGGDDVVAAVMAGNLSDVPSATERMMAATAEHLRDIGFDDKSVQETLSGRAPSAEEFALARSLKAQKMRSPEFTRRYLAGEPDARREMMAIDVVLTNGAHAQALGSAQGA